ncbi:hypothetical protein LX83_003807 [Goodfellowiella coeruleoviolacea]|uniref:ATP synthase protein I n=2 Tax=Goodfellowiella coeruleoviolacea TaxID=334858 RepID=A0AAE3GGI6_9PSEU|nr:hypothetical protein [Goodfellowiella coeruleoviolacea]
MLVQALLVLAVVVPLAVLGSWLAAGLPGLWGALLGAALGAGFMLVTVVSVLKTASASPNTTFAVIVGSWLVKAIALIGVLFLIRDMTFYSRPVFGLVAMVSLLVVLTVETLVVLRGRSLYVEPAGNSGAGQGKVR